MEHFKNKIPEQLAVGDLSPSGRGRPNRANQDGANQDGVNQSRANQSPANQGRAARQAGL